VNIIAPVEDTNVIRYADFVRITTASAVYRFSTAPTAITVAAVDASPFTGLSQLVSIGSATRDIKSTANETTVTLVGIDTAMLSLVLGAGIKGSEIEMWHGFFDAAGNLITTSNAAWINSSNYYLGWTNSTGVEVPWQTSVSNSGLYQYFTGFINSFSISEQWMEEIRGYVGTVTVSASSIQLILQNRTAGRYTNNNAWTQYNATDTSMNRVNFIQTINYQFGKNASPNS
jgi:hypothetical protein